jgi:chemotaxis protein MotA
LVSVVVLGAVLGGFMMAGGALGVMVQPSEFVCHRGAALGSLLVSTPGQVMAATVGS